MEMELLHEPTGDLETPMCTLSRPESEESNVRRLQLRPEDTDEDPEEESNSWVAFPKTAHVSARKVIQAGGVLLLAVTLIFAARGQGLLTFDVSSADQKTSLSHAAAMTEAHAKSHHGHATHTTHTTHHAEEKEENCHNAMPGDSCYGAVLWHKWIGLVETPQNYNGNLTRESDRHNIQSWLYRHGRDGCAKPCKESISYPVPKTVTTGGPQLYCFSVARTGPEMDSMFMQRQTGTGIFACNGFDVYSDHEIDIDGYKTKLIPSTAAGVSVDRTAANSQVFMKTWMYVLATDWWYKYDFLAKVDPDAILFPERLRGHVAAHVGQNVFFLNCAVHAPAMYGAVEVFAKSALGAYQSQHARCEHSLPFWSWGEDRFMQECLKMLGVAPVPDYNNNVRDARCWGSDCGNKGAVAFHPFKTVNGWYRCHLASQ